MENENESAEQQEAGSALPPLPVHLERFRPYFGRPVCVQLTRSYLVADYGHAMRMGEGGPVFGVPSPAHDGSGRGLNTDVIVGILQPDRMLTAPRALRAAARAVEHQAAQPDDKALREGAGLFLLVTSPETGAVMEVQLRAEDVLYLTVVASPPPEPSRLVLPS